MFATSPVLRLRVLLMAGLIAVMSFLVHQSASAQTTAPNEWTWMGGSSTGPNNTGRPGVYGTLTVPAAGNIPGGRASAATWTDNSGNLWLFGGEVPQVPFGNGNWNFLNDLWKFNPSTNEWAWMGGSSTVGSNCVLNKGNGSTNCGQPGVYGTLGTPVAGNVPGARYSAASWTDKNGNLWLFGGCGFDANGNLSGLNDLWEFDTTTNQWAWMGGSSSTAGSYGGQPGIYGTMGTPAVGNVPGARQSAASWSDNSGNFWLFGGQGSDANNGSYGSTLDDLWEFNPSTKEWAWMGGSSTGGQPGVYGTLGTPATGNVPGSHFSAVSWTDKSGNLWLFGGEGDPGVNGALHNDLWEFSPSTKEWAWMGGSSTDKNNCNINGHSPSCGLPGVYGTLGTPAAGNIPGNRSGAVSWTDSSGHLRLFGGGGDDVNGYLGLLNDLWEFNPSTKEWAWMGGSNIVPLCTNCIGGEPGLYGVLGTPAAGDVPGTRENAMSWTDSSGNFWLFGGMGFDANGNWVFLNDLWIYQPSSASLPTTTTPTLSVPAGTYTATQSVTISDTTNGATIYYTTDGSTPTTNSAVYSGPITVKSTETIQAIAAASGCLTSASATAAYVIVPSPTFFPVAGTYTTVQTVKISVATPGATIYYTTDGTTPTASSSVYSSPIIVSSTETIEAIATASGIPASTVATAGYLITQSAVGGALQWSWMGGSNNVPPMVGSSLEGQPGVYGTLGTFAPGNIPGGSQNPAIWTDHSGNFWLFGGWGNVVNGNDLWEFNPSTNEWAWINGSSTATSSLGIYGTEGTPAAGNIPGGRGAAASWIDNSGNLWLFGGGGASSNSWWADLNDMWEFNPSTKEWTWMAGSSTVPSNGILPCQYGTLGTPAAGNLPGGRFTPVYWTDNSGNFWLFGGDGNDASGNYGYLNDLWEFNPSTNEWAWMGGSSTISSMVSGQCSSGEMCGNPGVYGAQGTPAAGNFPGGRSDSASWVDSNGNFWLFGGAGADANGKSGYLNDVWEFNPSTKVWTWMGGSETIGSNCVQGSSPLMCGHSGVYGTLGTPASGNIPGSRAAMRNSSWVDSYGQFWLFGGQGLDANGNSSELNDLWVFSPTKKEWAWMGGSSTIGSNLGQPGVYGRLETPAGGEIPGGRASAASWTDSSGNLWLFGGRGFDVDGIYGELNDLWEYQPSAILLPPAATPNISLAAGSYTAAQTVILSDATPAATIYYTTNGSTPTTASTVYSGPITISASETLEAMAAASGYANSSVATAIYTINVSTNPVPFIGSMTPAYASAGDAAFTLTVNGLNFSSNSAVYWGTTALTTNYVSATQLTAQVPATDIATADIAFAITVQTPAPGGGTSDALTFQVDSAASTAAPPTFTTTTAVVASGASASYSVTLPSSVTATTVSCLNLPSGASCSYSATANSVTITTSPSTPPGTYQITVVFNETITSTTTSWILLPVLLLPLVLLRRRMAARGAWMTACLVLVLLAGMSLCNGCGGGGGNSGGSGGGGGGGGGGTQTHQATSSKVVTLTIK
jgi:N-acetylneuraminic acid mutarotase